MVSVPDYGSWLFWSIYSGYDNCTQQTGWAIHDLYSTDSFDARLGEWASTNFQPCPYTVRGKVQKCTSGKAYEVMFIDLAVRAVHIGAVFVYDTSSFLVALSRFAGICGWPEKIFSDPDSQLVVQNVQRMDQPGCSVLLISLGIKEQ